MKKLTCNCDCASFKEFTAELQKNALSMWLFAICFFLLGIVLGFIFSPKKSFSVGCNNSAVTYEAEEEKCQKGKHKKKK
ncbi:MAG: hypothetical protein K6G82_06760 [Ruminococcus sp.]|nr:hypothetical protein [Ruminococcus sp.]